MRTFSDGIATLGGHIVDLAGAIADIPEAIDWLIEHWGEQEEREAWLVSFGKLVAVIVSGIVIGLIVFWALRRPRRWVEGLEEPSPWLQPALLLYNALLRAVPNLVAAGAGYGVLTVIEPADALRVVALAIISAHLIASVVKAVGTLVLAPYAPQLRLVPITDVNAAYCSIWWRRLVNLGAYGYVFCYAALLLGLPESGHAALIRLLGILLGRPAHHFHPAEPHCVRALAARDRADQRHQGAPPSLRPPGQARGFLAHPGDPLRHRGRVAGCGRGAGGFPLPDQGERAHSLDRLGHGLRLRRRQARLRAGLPHPGRAARALSGAAGAGQPLPAGGAQGGAGGDPAARALPHPRSVERRHLHLARERDGHRGDRHARLDRRHRPDRDHRARGGDHAGRPLPHPGRREGRAGGAEPARADPAAARAQRAPRRRRHHRGADGPLRARHRHRAGAGGRRRRRPSPSASARRPW